MEKDGIEEYVKINKRWHNYYKRCEASLKKIEDHLGNERFQYLHKKGRKDKKLEDLWDNEMVDIYALCTQPSPDEYQELCLTVFLQNKWKVISKAVLEKDPKLGIFLENILEIRVVQMYRDGWYDYYKGGTYSRLCIELEDGFQFQAKNLNNNHRLFEEYILKEYNIAVEVMFISREKREIKGE
jgi:hypothetical protein